MKTKYSKAQISNAITHWKKVLESMEADGKPAESVDEGIKDMLTKNIIFKNDGVKNLVAAIQKAQADQADDSNVRFAVKVGEDSPKAVTGFVISPTVSRWGFGKNPLVFKYNPNEAAKSGAPGLKTLEDMHAAIDDAKVDNMKMSSTFTGIGLVVGVDEASGGAVSVAPIPDTDDIKAVTNKFIKVSYAKGWIVLYFAEAGKKGAGDKKSRWTVG